MNTAILVGADPEAFVKNVHGTIISAVGMIGGDKKNPRPVKKGAVQEDNVLAEFNIDPASTEEEFVENIQTVKEELEKIIFPNVLDFKSFHTFQMEYLFGIGSQAFEFGCDPDFNSWTLSPNSGIETNDTPNRTAGGHVHVGFPTKKKPMEDFRVACMMDLYLGLPALLYTNELETSRRREMYGKAGACRPKPYGVEYRALSNFWISDEKYMRWVFRNSVLAYKNRDKLEDILKLVNIKDVIQKMNHPYDSKAFVRSVASKLDIPLVGE